MITSSKGTRARLNVGGSGGQVVQLGIGGRVGVDPHGAFVAASRYLGSQWHTECGQQDPGKRLWQLEQPWYPDPVVAVDDIRG